MVNFYPALRLHQCLFRDHCSAVWTLRDLAQHEFVRSTFVENIGNNPIERQLRIIRTAALTASDLRFRLSDCFRLHGDQFNSWPRKQFISIESALQRPLVRVFVISKQVPE